MDYLTFITTYKEDRYDPRIDKLCGSRYNYCDIAQFLAFASATLAVSVTALLDYIDNDTLQLEEISACCLDKKHWQKVQLVHFRSDGSTPT